MAGPPPLKRADICSGLGPIAAYSFRPVFRPSCGYTLWLTPIAQGTKPNKSVYSKTKNLVYSKTRDFMSRVFIRPLQGRGTVAPAQWWWVSSEGCVSVQDHLPWDGSRPSPLFPSLLHPPRKIVKSLWIPSVTLKPVKIYRIINCKLQLIKQFRSL